ncbi:MAG: CDGSH iron-sulfur domain-containing protein [Desulfitobacteriaceae bacterium]|nr:CDGSH iron-sulfur domain-containing protein [Desulfitobacteriaceae bacterium]MDI6915814.1 CDGSH iron-sulfur domain-containing protein [Desulfitobacteriaceae bacterium]
MLKDKNVPRIKIMKDGAWDCPAGRLIPWDKKTGQSIEPKLEPSLGIIEDPPEKVSGPIWVKGGISLESSDGSQYEVRNQVTLCRCGKSRNKLFCDATHVAIGYIGQK